MVRGRPSDEMIARAAAFRAEMERRRSVRAFSDRPIPRSIIEDCLRAAVSGPSGANQQPWRFIVVTDPETKRRIRIASEDVERRFYGGGAGRAWLEALAPLGTDARKPFLEIAPCLIAVFAERFGIAPDGSRTKRYYPVESTGIAIGILIAALHVAGLATLPYTPHPMGFLNRILGRPANERPILILVAGYPAEAAKLPKIDRKPFDEVVSFV